MNITDLEKAVRDALDNDPQSLEYYTDFSSKDTKSKKETTVSSESERKEKLIERECAKVF